MFLKNIRYIDIIKPQHAWLLAVRLWSVTSVGSSSNAEHGTKSIFPIKPAKGCWDQKMDHRPNQSWSPPIHLHHPLSSRSTSMETPTQYLLYISTYQAQLNLLSALPFSIVRVVTIKRGMRRWDGPGNWGQVTLDTGHWTSNHNMTPITALASSPPTRISFMVLL